ncbi:MAG: trehalase family glycosidase [Elusimicrobiota bacterium]
MPSSRTERPLRELSANETPRYIVPSHVQYPHQWLWDSCFHAIVLAHLRPASAAREIESLLEGQWDDGRVPHLCFSPAIPPGKYRPNAEDWNTGRASSGIIQPPIIATAAKAVFQRTGDDDFLRRVYPKIAAFHRWIKDTRDPHETGLVGIVHPWESGMDNSPVWDGPRADFLRGYASRSSVPPRADTRAVPSSQRPTDEDYRFYWGLVEALQREDWDGRRMAERSPMFVADVLFNSLWAKANEDLSQIAWRLGRKGDSSDYRFSTTKTRRAIREILWSPGDGFFYPFDLRKGEPIRVKTAGGFMPLFAQAATTSMAAELIEHLSDRREFYSAAGVPSVSLAEESFEPERYWRGPVWVNIQWLLVQGLVRYGCFELAHSLGERIRRVVADQGYWEYYDPFSGKGLGAPHFSWSTLADVIEPLDPPPELRANVQVLPSETAERDEELATLYLHPEAIERPIEPEQVLSTPRYITRRVLDQVHHEARQAGLERGGEPSPERLRHAASALKGLIQSQRGLSKEYPRISDLACVAGELYLKDLGFDVRTVSNKYLHHYLVVEGIDGRRWIVDLTGSQFASYPAARVPLLFERLTLRVEREIGLESPSWMRLEDQLLLTQYAVEGCLRRLGADRLDRVERQTLLIVLRRHEGCIDRLIRLALPSSSPYLKSYQQWLSAIIAPLTTRANDPMGRRVKRAPRMA